MFLFLTAGDIGHPVCSKCPPGFIYRAFKCEKCPNGTSSVEGSETCSLKEGQKINPSSKDSCKIYCQVGKGMDLKTGFCQWCPYHTYQNRTDVPNVNCSACPEGKKTPYPGTIDIDQCYVPCQTGTFFSLKDQKCLSCPSGTYQETKEHLYTRCKNCDQGKVTYSDGSTDSGQCVPSCAKGHYLDSETSQCLKCPYGSYQDKINQLNCTRCFVGGSTLKNGSSEQTDCVIKCQKGTYFDEKERRCLECPKGTYMDQDGHLIFSCIKCAGNKTTQSHSAVNESQCLDKCDSGEYFSVKNKSCELCPLGTFMDKSGHLIPSCKQCGGKKTTYEQGATNENLCNDECTVGNYFNSTTSSCMACPKGSYQSKTAQKTCLSCPPGLSTRSPGETSKLACVKFMCGPGKLINSTGECQACPSGTYQSAVNHTLSSCQQCPSKMSNVQGATNPNSCTKVCDAFPCENGVKCIEKADAYCECPRGLTGKRCEVIENREVLVKLEIALRFISLNWSKELSDKTRSEYRITKYRIEKSLRIVFEGDESFVGVQVNEFVKGSVIANFDLYTNESASLVPAKTLQTAVRRGSIGGLSVDAEYLRIKQATCDRALGMEDGGIKDGLISATSESDGQEANHGRLNSAKGWLAKDQGNFTNYIQISFNSSMNVTAIATQGDAVGSFVTAYSLSFRKDGGQWMSLKETVNSTLAKNFTGNNDTNTVIKNILPEPITSVKDIRVIPVTWSNGIGMRIEFYGCISDPVLSPTEIPTQGTEQPTQTTTGPNVEAVGSKEDAYSWGKYLGITFGLLMVVGCLIAFFMWWRSAKKKQREKAPLVMTKLQGSEYQVIDKDDEDLGYDEAAV